MLDKIKAFIKGLWAKRPARKGSDVQQNNMALKSPIMRRLRRRLTVILTSLTGLILAAVLAASLYFTLNTARTTAEESFITSAALQTPELFSIAVGEAQRYTTLEEQSGFVILSVVNAEVVDFVPGVKITTNRTVLMEEVQDSAYSMGAVVVVANVANEGFLVEAGDAISAVLEDSGEMNDSAREWSGWGATSSAEAYDGEDADIEDYSMFDLYYTISNVYAENTLYLQGENGESFRAMYTDYYDEVTDEYREIAVLQELGNEQAARVWICVGYAVMLLAGLALLVLVNWWLSRLVVRPTAEGLQRQAEFVAAASHELRSPLAVMRSSLSAVRAAPDEEQEEKYTAAAENEAERMSRLVDDLLLLAGGDAGSWKLQSEDVDVDTLLIETAEHFTPLAQKQDNTLLLRLPEETLGTVRGDADRLHQILSVLLDNALQYAPAGSGIVLSAVQKKGGLAISVIDHGPGIPDDDKPRVFERFYRADTSRTDKKHFGLGLSVAKELATLHGGRLAVKDTEGGGATFTLTLPKAAQGKE